MKFVAVDTETTSVNAFIARVTHASCCDERMRSIAFEWRDAEKRAALVRVMENPNIVKVFHNAKYDLRVLHNAGITCKGDFYDTMIMSQLSIDSHKHGLKELTNKLLEEHYNEEVELKKWMRRNKAALHEAPPEILLPYAEKDAVCTAKLFIFLWEILKKRRMLPLLKKEMEIMRRCAIKMESRGVLVDRKECEALAEEAQKIVDSRTRAMREMTDDFELNPNSFQQMGRYIFADRETKKAIQLATGNKFNTRKAYKFTASGHPSTDNFSLQRAGTPLAKLLLDYRLYNKALKTYLIGTLDLLDPNNIVHGSFNQCGARTGRFSCSEPNLQNIPKDPRTFMGKIRKIFRARPNYCLLFSDYDQIEIKLAAHFSMEQWMLDVIRTDGDLHDRAANEYFNVFKKQADWKLMRDVAKRMNYAMLYGAGAYRLHRALIEEAGINIPIKECEGFVDAYWSRNQSVLRLRDHLEQKVYDEGGITNPYGRFVQMPPDFAYAAINALIQSTAGDIIKDKMLICADILRGSQSHLIIMVHDELIFEIHREDKHLIPLLVEAMEENSRFSIPITCSAKWGKNWMEKKRIPESIMQLEAA